jgi:hypothetical protein
MSLSSFLLAARRHLIPAACLALGGACIAAWREGDELLRMPAPLKADVIAR